MSKKAVLEPTRPAVPPLDTPAPPAYFLSASVENFRCFGEKQTLDLSDGNGNPKFWTIILGDNGVGKTTLLQLMAMLRPILAPRYSERPNDTMASCTAAFGYRYIDVNDLNIIKNGNQLAQDSVAWLQADLSSTTFSTKKNNNHITKSALRAWHDNKQIDLVSTVLPTTASQFLCYGYGASRRPGHTAIADEQNNDTCASLFGESAELVNAEEWLLQADYAASKGQERAKQRLKKVIEVLKGLLPDVSDFKFEPLSELTDLPIVQAETPYGWVPVRSLSLGYQSLITWTVDLASRLFARYPDSPNPLAEPAVVLVDEIDLHLHPKWQRTLIQFLTETFPKTQFIVTAHSPLVVQAAPDANIVVLRRERDHVVIDNDVKVVEGWRADQILTSDLFGLSSARPPEWDAFLDERDQILSKHTLSEQDHARLKELENLIAELPTGESSSDLAAMDIIRRAATMLKKRGDNGK